MDETVTDRHVQISREEGRLELGIERARRPHVMSQIEPLSRADTLDLVARKRRNQEKLHPSHKRFRARPPPLVVRERIYTGAQRSDIHFDPDQRGTTATSLRARLTRFALFILADRLRPAQRCGPVARLWSRQRLERWCETRSRKYRKWRCASCV